MTPRPPKKIVLDAVPPLPSGARTRQAGEALPAPPGPWAGSLISWLVPILMLGAVALSVLLLSGRVERFFGLALAILLGVGFLWMGVSIFFPPRADRSCPGCGAESLERLDPRSTSGLRCAACGWQDETRSAWLLAEEEGPLEEIVMEERGRRRGPGPSGTRPTDTGTGPETPTRELPR